MTPPGAVDPYDAAPPPPEPSGPSRPPTVDYSFWAGIASPVAGLAMVVASMLMMTGADFDLVLRQSMAPGQPTFTPEQAHALFRIAMAMVIVFCLVLAGLWIMFLFFMRRGRNWARIVITVVGALWILLTLPSVLVAASALGALLSLLQIAAIAATIVFAFLSPSNQYFQLAGRR